MVLAYNAMTLMVTRDSHDKVRQLAMYQTCTFDGTGYWAVFPATRADLARIREIVGTKAMKVIHMSLYHATPAQSLSPLIGIVGSDALAPTSLTYVDEVDLAATPGSLSKLDKVEGVQGRMIRPQWSELPGDTGVTATSRSVFSLSFGGATWAPANTETITLHVVMEVVD